MSPTTRLCLKQRFSAANWLLLASLLSSTMTSFGFLNSFGLRPEIGITQAGMRQVSLRPHMTAVSPRPLNSGRGDEFFQHSLQDENNCVWPRILVVSRRHVRKGKYVDFVGEYHIDLLQEYGAAPILVPRTLKTLDQLDAFTLGGVDGILLMEGADIGEQYQPFGDGPELMPEELAEIASKYASDCEIDEAKDALEMTLIQQKVLRDGVPYLGLCRGSQLLNVAMGGSLYCDVAAETGSDVVHMDYSNYDGHRHPINVLPDTPLASWFPEAFREGRTEGRLDVNSYHHQGVKELAEGLRPMCFAEDGLMEGFWDPANTDPRRGAFRVGLQWHPERMLADYAGCRKVYAAFVDAAQNHRRRTLSAQQPQARRPAAPRSTAEGPPRELVKA